MHFFKVKYFLYGILISISLNFIITQANIADGEFGVYFERMTGICNTGEVITGYSGDSLNFGEKECTPFKEIVGSIFGGSIPANSTVIGFSSTGEILYAPNHWKENGGNISYTGNNVGIGINLPTSKLDIVGGNVNVRNISGNIAIGSYDITKDTNISNGISFFNAGNVGFGKTNPTVAVDVLGDMKVSNTTIVPRIILNGTELKAPPSCFGANQALQWDGTNWSCGTLPTIGSCNATVANTCTKGTPSGYNPGVCGGNATWTCDGANGGASVNCTKANAACVTPVNGSCGSANGTTTTSYPTSNWCITGTKVDIDTTGGDGSYNWRCDGANGGSNASCSATKTSGIGTLIRLGSSAFNIYQPVYSTSVYNSIFGWPNTNQNLTPGQSCLTNFTWYIKPYPWNYPEWSSPVNVSGPTRKFGLLPGHANAAGTCIIDATVTYGPYMSQPSAPLDIQPRTCYLYDGTPIDSQHFPGTRTDFAIGGSYQVGTLVWNPSAYGSADQYYDCIIPVNGACGGAANTCSIGSPSGYNAGSCGGNATWTCNGSGGGSNASCSIVNAACIINGVCGSANGVSTASYPTSNWCTTGTKVDIDTTGSGGTYNWRCDGSGGGSNASCSASKTSTINCSDLDTFWGIYEQPWFPSGPGNFGSVYRIPYWSSSPYPLVSDSCKCNNWECQVMLVNVNGDPGIYWTSPTGKTYFCFTASDTSSWNGTSYYACTLIP